MMCCRSRSLAAAYNEVELDHLKMVCASRGLPVEDTDSIVELKTALTKRLRHFLSTCEPDDRYKIVTP
jgi:hypothetical protein